MRLPKGFGPIVRAMACMKDKSLKKTIKENNKSSRPTPLLSSFETTPRRDYWLSRFHQSKSEDCVYIASTIKYFFCVSEIKTFFLSLLD